MIAVRVCTQDRADALALEQPQQRADMFGIIAKRPGIDHRDLAGADDIALRAGIAECRGVAREHAPHQRADALGDRIGLFRKIGHIHHRHVAASVRAFKGGGDIGSLKFWRQSA